MKFFARVFLFIGVLCLLFSFGQDSVFAKGKNASLKTYTNEIFGFQAKIPSDWLQSDDLGLQFLNTTPDVIKGQEFRANIALAFDPGPTPLTLQEYVNENLGILKAEMPKFKLLKQKTLKVNGLNAVLIDYTTQDVRILQLIGVDEENTPFTISGGAHSKVWKKYQKMLESSLKSFKFLK